MSSLPNPREGYAVRAQGDSTGVEVTMDDLKQFAVDTKHVHIVGMYMRPGTLEFMALVENRMFPSDTILESALHVHATLWQGLPWIICSVPTAALEQIRAVAAEVGLEVKHTVPVAQGKAPVTAIGSLAVHRVAPEFAWFPLKLSNVYTLESVPETRATRPGSGPRQGWG